MTSSFRRRAPHGAALLVAALVLSACSAPAETQPAASASPTGHGIDGGGAGEVVSPALALVIADDRGALTLLDLDTEERSSLARGRDDETDVFGDGRLFYRVHDDAGATSVEVFDTARWTVPHGDHTHSFRGEPRLLGAFDGEGAVRLTVGERRSALAFEGGEVVLLAHDELAEGLEAAPRVPVEARGPIVPFAGHLLAVTSDASIEVLDLTGAAVPGAGASCTDASDADVTRVGTVFACADGAALFTREVGGVIAVETLAYPADAAAAMDLSGRPDRPDLAGVAGSQGAWLLDVRQRRWTLLPSDVPLLRAAALGDDDSRTVAIDMDGRVRVLAPDGRVLVRTEPLLAASVADPLLRDRVQLLVDARHAYVTDPATGAVHEIDHDDGRVTRTFAALEPWFIQQVG